MNGDSSWALGTVIWLPICAVVVLLFATATFWLFCRWRDDDSGIYSDRPIYLAGWISTAVIIVLLVGGTAFGMYPYKAEYHKWTTESGVVAAIDSRLIGSGSDSGTTERFVVTLDGDQQRSCDDTRCAQVEVGDILTLSCKRHWQYTGTDGYDCNFVSRERAA